MPAVQNPHWSAWCSWNAALQRPGCEALDRAHSQPSAWTASVRQERTGSPSSWTVHAPQTPCSQPDLRPGEPGWSRMKSESSVRGSTSAS